MSGKGQSRPGWKLALIIFVYLTLAITYSVVTPIGRGADEWAHYWYAQFIAQHGRLPLNPAEREAAGYKSDWPPLYHLSAAAVTAWIDTAGPPTFKYRADPEHIRRQIIPAPSSEAILHTENELFPWQQEILVWHLGRFLSIVFSAGTLVITYQLALEVFTGSRVASSKVAGEQPAPHTLSPQTLALACTAFLALIPRFLFTGMLFNYDSLTLLAASLFLWLAVRVAKGYYPRWGFWILGGLAGLALLTKYLTALLPLEIILLTFSRGAGEQGSRGENSVSPLLKLGQALLAFLLVTSPWFGYLLVNFNEIKTYGPVLGTVAPLLRGDGSDRTVEQIFAAISGGQAPPPAHVDQQHYSAWQLISEFFTTFWINPITPPSPLNWFVVVITGIAIIALFGLIKWPSNLRSLRRSVSPSTPPPFEPKTPYGEPSNHFLASSPHLPPNGGRLLASLLLLHCLLPLPFMAVRLFGARDALEAVQGRHLLFLAGPAIAILLVWGISRLIPYASERSLLVGRITLYALTSLLLIGAILQLITMKSGYPPPLPVRTTPFLPATQADNPSLLTLPGGATVVTATVLLSERGSPAALPVTIFWRGGPEPAPEDYRIELALVDETGQTRANWLAYQTQARYPTRVWEVGDTIRDEGWLPLLGLPPGEFGVRWRILGEAGEVPPWQTLTTYHLSESISQPTGGVAGSNSTTQGQWLLWRQDKVVNQPPLLRERETAQFTFTGPRPPAPDPLIGSDGVPRPPTSSGENWANFIIGPDWPPGDYHWQPEGEVVLRVETNERNFQLPALPHPLEANFAGQVKLLGYDLPVRRVQPGDGLPLTLYWQGLRWMGEDFVIFNRLLDNQGVAWGGYDRRAKENYSTLFWAPGEVITDGFAIPVNPAAPPGIYTLSLGWYRRTDGQAESLPIINPETGEPGDLTAVTIGPVKVGGPPPGITVAQATPQTKVNVVLGEQIKLLGFDVANERMAAERDESLPRLLRVTSSPLHLTLYWQALVAPSADYTVFAHIRNAAGETGAQKDSPPVGGVYPTSLWDAGEIIKDELSIPLENVVKGEYDVVVGMYDFQTGLRLSIPENLNGEIVLAKITIDTP